MIEQQTRKEEIGFQLKYVQIAETFPDRKIPAEFVFSET